MARPYPWHRMVAGHIQARSVSHGRNGLDFLVNTLSQAPNRKISKTWFNYKVYMHF